MAITRPTAWKRNIALIVGLVAATIVPMGIHILMFDHLGIPDPTNYPKFGWPVLPDRVMMMLGVIYLAGAAKRLGDLRRPALTTTWVFLCTAAVNQDLLREGIMRNSVSTKWTIYPFIDNLPIILTIAAVSCLAVLLSSRCVKWWSWLIAAFALAIVYELIRYGTDALFVSVTAMTNRLEGDTKYFAPYGWRVNLPSYLTYSEAVLGACGVAAIISRQSGSRAHKMITATLTIFLIGGGPIFKPFLNIYFGHESSGIVILSYAQFTFETLTLAILVSGLWLTLAPNASRGLKKQIDRSAPSSPSPSSLDGDVRSGSKAHAGLAPATCHPPATVSQHESRRPECERRVDCGQEHPLGASLLRQVVTSSTTA